MWMKYFMGSKLFLDTSALYAYFNNNDENHEKISSFLDSSSDAFYTSNYIVDELITLLRFRNKKLNISQIKPFIDDLFSEKFTSLLYVNSAIDRIAWAFMNKFKDHEFSFKIALPLF